MNPNPPSRISTVSQDPLPTNSPSTLQATPKGHPRNSPRTVSPWGTGGVAFCKKRKAKAYARPLRVTNTVRTPTCRFPALATLSIKSLTYCWVLLGSGRSGHQQVSWRCRLLNAEPTEKLLRPIAQSKLHFKSDVLRLVCVPQTACP